MKPVKHILYNKHWKYCDDGIDGEIKRRIGLTMYSLLLRQILSPVYDQVARQIRDNIKIKINPHLSL